MAYWLTYQSCPECIDTNCLQCRLPGRRLTLSIAWYPDNGPPEHALHGPFPTTADALRLIPEFFEFDVTTGLIHFRVIPTEDTG